MSKGLEAWEYTRENYLQLKKEKYSNCKDVNNILERCDKRCDIIEKELKALEIVKKFAKSIDLKYFFCDNLIILIIGGDDFEWQYKCSSQDEYDLLKEALEK